MSIRVAIVGGTGVGQHLTALGGAPLHIPTEYGTVRGRKVPYDGVELLMLSRHSAGHKVPPHRVNYLAIATALKQLGVEFCLSSAAVGGLRPEWPAGTLVVCSDFFDMTYRNLTAFDSPGTFIAGSAHVDFSDPFSAKCRAAMISAAAEQGVQVETKGIYLGLNGPRYETPEEIKLFVRMGADLVGMTASSEAIVMRECGINYGLLSIVTNLAAGISEHALSHSEVEAEMVRKGPIAVKLLLAAAVSLSR